MSSSYFNFSGAELLKYDAYDENPYEWNFPLSKMQGKNQNLLLTQDPFQENHNLSSRSKKTCLNPFESSFQCNFLYEHTQTCNNKFQNLMESVSSCSKKIQISTLKSKLLLENSDSKYESLQILESANCQIESSEKDQFKTDLMFEKKLKEFLDQICQKFVPEVSGELLTVANFVWNQYLKVSDSRFFQQELKEWAQNLVEDKYSEYGKFLQKTKEICFLEDESQAFPNFEEIIKGFLKYYFVTVVFVIEQYFQNPFFNEGKAEFNSFKRLSSEQDFYSSDQFSELQEDIMGSKKLKF